MFSIERMFARAGEHGSAGFREMAGRPTRSAGLNVYKPMVTVQIQHGQVVTVRPAEVATAKAMYPTPAWTARQ